MIDQVEGYIESLTEAERDQLLRLMALFKNHFATVAAVTLGTGREMGIPERAGQLVLVSECLLLAASMFGGDRDGFLKVASRAHHDAKIVVAYTRTQ